MTAVVLTPIDPAPILAWQITTATAPNLVEALAVAATVGFTGTVVCTPQPEDQPAVWEMRLSRPNYPTEVGHVDDWIIYDGTRVFILSDEQRRVAYTAESG